MSLHQALLIITLAMIPLTIAIPLVAMASDNLFRRTHTLAVAYVLAGIAAIPLFIWASSGNALQVGGVALVFALIAAFPLALSPAMLAEAFDRKHRLTGYSLSFNVGMALGGGTAPMIATWLIHVSGETLAPAYYLAFGALLATVALVASRDRSREPLR